MRFNLKVWHLLVLVCGALIILRLGLILNSLLLFIRFVMLLINSPSNGIPQVSFPLIDSFLAAALVITMPVYFYLERKKYKIFSKRLNFTSVILLVLLIFFLLAPIVANWNPYFQKDLSVTRLLPPLSSLKVLHLKQKENDGDTALGKFIKLKNQVVKQPFNEELIFADSLKSGQNIVFYQHGASFEIPIDTLKTTNGRPLITTKYFILGTDELGRDIFSRLVYGARISLFVGLGSVVISLLIGLFLGFIAGYPGGPIDSVISRITDMFLAFPVIFLIILILALFGNSLVSVIVVLGFSGWMSLFKIVRGEVILLKKKDFFISAKLIGLSKISLLLKEVLPVILAPVIVNLVFQYSNVILAEAALSYLGLGTGSIYPSWGSMIEAGQNYLAQAWWMIFFPGFLLTLTLLAANNLGKEINSFFNPRIKL